MASIPIQGDFGVESPLTVVPPKKRGAKRVWYKPNHRSFGAFMKSDQMRDVTEEVARDIAVVATASVPAPSEETPADATDATYEVKRNAGLIKVGGNLRVKVVIEGRGRGAERAEFGGRGAKRYRTLAEAGSRFGDWKPVD